MAAVVVVVTVFAFWALMITLAWLAFGHRRPYYPMRHYRRAMRDTTARCTARSGAGAPQRAPLFSPSSSTARNASWGTSIRPTCFILCLPFFCCSSSLRLRLMSPP